MKAVTPVRPQDSSSSSTTTTAAATTTTSSNTSSGSPLSLHYLSKQSLNIARCRMEEEDLLCLQYDMNDCYTRLKRLVPTIPQDKKVSRVEILQHVIDYILDLQLALETHPSLHKQQPLQSCPPPASSNPGRTPLTVLNIDHHQRTSIGKKPEDSILCR
ncbi:DNA-binding protein inhibitor ID-4 [Nelusetta ayraudi]|uniref:DNA-binding protein inhibitor ID-4 n=1 Tax=Nelusetta ayraudi TaxID=303726 RepID=UPI003F6F9DEC